MSQSSVLPSSEDHVLTSDRVIDKSPVAELHILFLSAVEVGSGLIFSGEGRGRGE
jgi:hypothetical protein